jgi:hypothetical protein
VTDTFETIAEIAIALTGFTGIVTVLGRRGRGDWSARDLFRVKALLYWSLSTMFLAFLPTFLLGLGEVVAAPWRVAHGVFACFHSAVFVWFFREVGRTGTRLSRFAYSSLVIGALVLFAEILVACGLFQEQAPSLYLLALLWFLYLAAGSFAMILFDPEA